MGSKSYIAVNPQQWISVEAAPNTAIQQAVTAIQQLQLGKQLPAASLAATADALGTSLKSVQTQQSSEDLLRSLYYHSPSAADQGALALQLFAQLQPEDLIVLEELLEEPDPYNLLQQRLGAHNVKELLDSAATGDLNAKNQALLQVTRDMLLPQDSGNNGNGPPPPPPPVAVDGADPDPDRDLIAALRRGDIGAAQRILDAEHNHAAIAARLADKGENLQLTLQGYVDSSQPAISALAIEALSQIAARKRARPTPEVRTASALSAQEHARLRAMVMSPTSNLASLSSTFNLAPPDLTIQLGNLLLGALRNERWMTL